jgi:hypothetical protein
MGTHIQETTALGTRRRPTPEFCQDSHACDLGELLNKGRRTLPRVRRTLGAPEHAQRPTPRAPRHAEPRPCLLLAPAPIRAHRSFNRTPPCALHLTGARDHRCLPCKRRARGTRSPATIDRPAEPFPAMPDPRKRPCMPR